MHSVWHRTLHTVWTRCLMLQNAPYVLALAKHKILTPRTHNCRVKHMQRCYWRQKSTIKHILLIFDNINHDLRRIVRNNCSSFCFASLNFSPSFTLSHSPCLCRRPRRRAHHPGRVCRRHHAPTGGPAASSWHPGKRVEEKVTFKIMYNRKCEENQINKNLYSQTHGKLQLQFN